MYEKAAQPLKLTISTPNFLHHVGLENSVPSNITVVTNLVKSSYSLLVRSISNEIYTVDVLH
jgi:hypothetical protein